MEEGGGITLAFCISCLLLGGLARHGEKKAGMEGKRRSEREVGGGRGGEKAFKAAH